MEAPSFYGSRKTTRVRTLREAYEAVQKASQVVNVVVLPLASVDTGSQESDTEEADDDPEESYEFAGELEVEEEIQSDENYDTQKNALPTRMRLGSVSSPPISFHRGTTKDGFAKVLPPPSSGPRGKTRGVRSSGSQLHFELSGLQHQTVATTCA